MKPLVFLSHASADRRVAAEVCAVLEAGGIGCWIAPRDITPGRQWGESIVQALGSCPLLVLVLSAAANGSAMVAREVERAAGKGALLVTLRVEPVMPAGSLEFFLSAQHWLDAFPPPLAPHLRRLEETVRELLGNAEARQQPQAAADDDDVRLAREFNEHAPDDWGVRPGSRLGRFFRFIFDDR